MRWGGGTKKEGGSKFTVIVFGSEGDAPSRSLGSSQAGLVRPEEGRVLGAQAGEDWRGGDGREDERGGRMSASGGLSEGWKEEKGPGPWKHTKTKGPPSHVLTGVRAASGQAARKRVRLKGGPFWLFGDTPSRQPPRAGAARAPPAPAPARAGFYQYWSTHGWCGRGGRGGGRRRAAACKVFLSHVNRPRSLLPFCAHLPRPARAPPRPQPVAVQ